MVGAADSSLHCTVHADSWSKLIGVV